MAIVVVTPATGGEPITLDDAKLHLRVVGTDEDTLIGAYITACRQHVENVCLLAIGRQTWRLTLDGFPANNGPIELPGGRVATVTELTYVDPLGVVQTWAPADLALNVRTDLDSVPARLTPAATTLGWPNWQPVTNAVTVTYTVGDPAPQPIRAAMLLMIADLYENRQQLDMNLRASVAESPTAKRLLFPYKRVLP